MTDNQGLVGLFDASPNDNTSKRLQMIESPEEKQEKILLKTLTVVAEYDARNRNVAERRTMNLGRVNDSEIFEMIQVLCQNPDPRRCLLDCDIVPMGRSFDRTQNKVVLINPQLQVYGLTDAGWGKYRELCIKHRKSDPCGNYANAIVTASEHADGAGAAPIVRECQKTTNCGSVELQGHLLIRQFREKLLAILPELDKKSSKPFQKLVEIIREVTDCDACSLWRINIPEDSPEERRFRFVSLIARTLKEGLKDKSGNDANCLLQDELSYVHPYAPSFTATALEYLNESEASYYCCRGKELEKCKNTCHAFVKDCEIQCLIGIPIENENKETIAILKLYFQKNHDNNNLDNELLDEKNGLLDVFSRIVSPYISHYYHQILSQSRLSLLDALMREYRNTGEAKKNVLPQGDDDASLENLFKKFINNGGIFQGYFQYKGASFFVWDDLNNYFQLCATTGLLWENGQEVNPGEYHEIHYTPGEGSTGQSADSRYNPEAELVIYDDFDHSLPRTKPFYEVKNGKTMMLVPISSPTNTNEVIGILRFVSKQHAEKSGVLDYFNNTDEDLFENVAPYLALIIQRFLDKDKQIRQFARITHEANTPAQTILLDIKTIIKNLNLIKVAQNDDGFSNDHLFSFCAVIEKAATLLWYQSESNLLHSKISKLIHRPPFMEMYPDSNEKTSVRKLLESCRQLVIPIVRAAKVSFDKITITCPDVRLFLGQKAFQIVFYNLLTNAIKYRKLDNNDSFSIKVILKDRAATDGCYLITVADNGIGIDESKKESIFLAGNRGGREKDNIQGFGLGLHIAKIIVEDFGGTIYVSHAKSPTAITIALPAFLNQSTADDEVKKMVEKVFWNVPTILPKS